MSSEDDELISAQSGDDNDIDNAATTTTTTTNAATTTNASSSATTTSSNRRVTRDTLPVHRHRDRIFIFDRKINPTKGKKGRCRLTLNTSTYQPIIRCKYFSK
jgi:hypothetical protein